MISGLQREVISVLAFSLIMLSELNVQNYLNEAKENWFSVKFADTVYYKHVQMCILFMPPFYRCIWKVSIGLKRGLNWISWGFVTH